MQHKLYKNILHGIMLVSIGIAAVGLLVTGAAVIKFAFPDLREKYLTSFRGVGIIILGILAVVYRVWWNNRVRRGWVAIGQFFMERVFKKDNSPGRIAIEISITIIFLVLAAILLYMGVLLWTIDPLPIVS